jgi:hypothetical protein
MAWAGISPSSLEVNLASFPVDSYPTTPTGGGATNNGIFPSCPSNYTIRDCIRYFFNNNPAYGAVSPSNYVGQGVTGVRFMFALRGGGGNPAGTAFNNMQLQLASGTLLTFAVNDPGGVIVDTASGPLINGLMPLFGGNFRIGVMLGPYYARAEFASQQSTVRTYIVAVPKSATLSLFPDTQLRLSDPTSGPLVTGKPSLSVRTGSAATQTVNLQVE